MQNQPLFGEYLRVLIDALVGCGFLAITWAASRTRRWLAAHLARELRNNSNEIAKLIGELSATHFREHNKTLKTLCDSFAKPERPSLDELLEDAEAEWSLRPSRTTPDPGPDELPTQLLKPEPAASPPLHASPPWPKPPSKR